MDSNAKLVEDDVYDVLIVGAGPCGLAVAARLREHTPAAMFTDEEHRRFHWINKYGRNVSLRHVKSGKMTTGQQRQAKAARPERRMLVLDATASSWMARWKRLFAAFGISHLRSPMLWHVDPLDRDALLAHAYANERAHELVEIRNCVGKEVSKHGKKKAMGQRAIGGKQHARVAINLRERNDYYTPSQSLFCDHCEKVADRYGLGSDVVRNESLEDLDYGVVPGVSAHDEKLFTVTSNSTRRYARAVVLAVGPGNTARVPRYPSMPATQTLPQACHSMSIGNVFPAPAVQARMAAGKPTGVLVVGGGLTSAQLADLAIRRGVSKVWLLMRGPMRIKHFDVDLQWMGKFKNAEHARFWYADSDEERLEIMREARGGGSITPPYHRRLKKHVASGRLAVHTATSIVDAKFEPVMESDCDGEGKESSGGSWTVTTDPPIAGLPPVDYIYFATGIQTDFTTLPYLQTMMRKHPIQGQGGFPCITDDLMWSAHVPLFVTGRLAALRLGPAAPNLGGAKIGAERIAWALDDVVPRPERYGEEQDEQQQEQRQKQKQQRDSYLSGNGNMYSSLVVEE